MSESFEKQRTLNTYDTDGGTERLGGQVVAEASLDHTAGAVGAGNAAPDDADLGAVLLLVGAVDVGDALAEVELRVLGRLDTFDLEKRHIGVLAALGTFVAQDTALGVKTRRFK